MQGRSNTILFPLAVLGLLALLTLWIDRTVQPPEPRVDGNTRHDPDYVLNNFVTTKTDTAGNISHVLKATEMRHYPDDDSTELENPHFTQYGVGKPSTMIEGKRGSVSSNGEIVKFYDDVRVVRQATADREEMTLTTDYLEVEPKREVAKTNRPVVITQGPKTVVRAVGMVYDKKSQTIQLNKRVRTHYEKPAVRKSSKPSKTKASAGASVKPVPKSSAKPAAKSTDKTPARQPANSTKQSKSSASKNAKLPTQTK